MRSVIAGEKFLQLRNEEVKSSESSAKRNLVSRNFTRRFAVCQLLEWILYAESTANRTWYVIASPSANNTAAYSAAGSLLNCEAARCCDALHQPDAQPTAPCAFVRLSVPRLP